MNMPFNSRQHLVTLPETYALMTRPSPRSGHGPPKILVNFALLCRLMVKFRGGNRIGVLIRSEEALGCAPASRHFMIRVPGTPALSSDAVAHSESNWQHMPMLWLRIHLLAR